MPDTWKYQVFDRRDGRLVKIEADPIYCVTPEFSDEAKTERRKRQLARMEMEFN